MKKIFILTSLCFLVLQFDVKAQDVVANYGRYYVLHEYSRKYLCTGGMENGSTFHTWGPIPPGHESRYSFQLVPTGRNGFYYILHEYSRKYLCAGGVENGSTFHTWGPIPPGHESRYSFQLIPTGRNGFYYILHEYSRKYLCAGGLENGSTFHTWGPIPPGHESRYSFQFFQLNIGLKEAQSPKLYTDSSKTGGVIITTKKISRTDPRQQIPLISSALNNKNKAIVKNLGGAWITDKPSFSNSKNILFVKKDSKISLTTRRSPKSDSIIRNGKRIVGYWYEVVLINNKKGWIFGGYITFI